MPVYLALTLDKVFLRTGPVRQAFPLAGQVRPAKPWDRLAQFGLLIHWPNGLGWLKLTADASADPPATAGPFSDTPAGLDAVCQQHGVRRDQLAPPKFLEANSYLVASLPKDNRVVLTVEIDTDDEGFRRTVQERGNRDRGELVQPIQLRFFDAKQFGTYVDQPGQLELTFKPCRPLPRFDGVLAIDLGNTMTTAAGLSESSPVEKTASIKMSPLDPAERFDDPATLPSVLRLDRIDSAGPVPEGTRRFPGVEGDDRPTAVTFEAGRAAVLGAGGDLPGVVFGAKQLLTVKEPAGPPGPNDPPPPDQYVTLVVPHARPGGMAVPEKVEVANRVPGELLFAHTIRQFRSAAAAWPGDLVLTYPTTYSPRELRQLTQAAARGWLRAMSQPEGFDRPPDPADDPALNQLAAGVRQWLAAPDPALPGGGLVGLMLDEATAAAIFFLYRRVFEQTGGMFRFRYLHPHGLRLLLVDCGGGTTDVALVRAAAPTTGLLEVDVLARTGLRGFGGDHVTREVARLVKAKLVLAAARLRKAGAVSAGFQPLPATGPTNPADARRVVEEFIAKARALDPDDQQLVPTKYAPADVSPPAQQARAAARALIRLADAVKRKLGDGKPVRLKELEAVHLQKETSALMAAVVGPLPAAAQTQLRTQIEEVSLSRWEVDALIREPLDGLVRKCNKLIEQKLRSSPDQEVDWVVLSGNGARYPLVREVLDAGLHVAYLGDRLTMDPQNLKHAVAKGAVMARMVQRSPQTVGIKYNRFLSDLLPYDVGFHNMQANRTDPLFAEYTPYADLAGATKTVKLVAPSAQAAGLGNTFILQRRFPGDDRYTPFASYRFAEGIQGELEVRYDPASGEFTVINPTTREPGVMTDLTDPKEHVSPVLRGDV